MCKILKDIYQQYVDKLISNNSLLLLCTPRSNFDTNNQLLQQLIQLPLTNIKTMPFSEPKPKVIYRNIEDIIKESFHSTRKSTSLKPTSKNNARIKTNTSNENTSLTKHTSRHSLSSKQQIRVKQVVCKNGKIDQNSICESSNSVNRMYRLQLERIYSQMEQLLRQSKQYFLQKQDCNGFEYELNLQKMQKMSKAIKEIFSYYNHKSISLSSQSANNRFLTEISCNNVDSVAKLSIQNQKKLKMNRRKGYEASDRKPSVYELALLKKR